MVNIIIILGITVAVFCAFAIYDSHTRSIFKAAILALVLVLGTLLYGQYILMMGKPIPARPVGEHAYIWHKIDGDMNILLWTYDREQGDRLYIFPYEREDAVKLEEMRQGAIDGNEQQYMVIDPDGSEGIQIYEGWDIPNQNFVKPSE